MRRRAGQRQVFEEESGRGGGRSQERKGRFLKRSRAAAACACGRDKGSFFEEEAEPCLQEG